MEEPRFLGQSITHTMVPARRAVGQWDNLTFYADQLPIETYETLLGKASVEVAPPSTTRHVRIAVFVSPCEYTFLPSSPVAPKSEHSERTKICELNTYPLFSGKMSLNCTDAIRNIGINVETTSREEFVEFLIDSPVPTE